jgi:outer membrane cobalamin receptor
MHLVSSSLFPRRISARLLCGVAAASLCAGGALAQTDEHDQETEVEELVVVAGQRTLPGAVIGDITPELSISPREIRAYGAASVTELLDALSPQLTSGQGSGGRPVVLINGGRITGFAEIRDLPTEAIARVDILPEEVSLKYGYPADQKVVNFVLRQRFKATLAEASGSTPTQDGGGQSVMGHGSVLNILRGQRLMLDARVTDTKPIYEGDRDIIGGEGDLRTLSSDTTALSLNGVYARPLGEGVNGTINAGLDFTDSQGKLGLSPFSDDALLRRSETTSGRIAAAAAGAYAGWQWSTTGGLTQDIAKSSTDRDFSGVPYTDRTKSTTTTAQTDLVLNRALWELPAGQVSTTLTARVSATQFESEADRLGVTTSNTLDRNIGQLQANFDVPLIRDGEGLGEHLGKLSANVNLGYQNLSDFGDLQTVGGGLNWTPIKPLRVLASFTRTDQAPTMNQLGDPLTSTPGVRVFDFRTGQTVEVTRVSGGLSTLDSSQRDTLKLGVSYKPWDKVNLNFQANYVSTRTDDAVAAFPSASTQIEDAFPDRFVRNAAGELTLIDARPVNFAKQSRDELRYGFTYSRPVGPQPTPEQQAAMRQRFQTAQAERQRAEGQQGQREGQGEQGQGQQGQRQQGGGQQRQGEGPPDGPPPGDGPPRGGMGGDGPRMGGGFGGPGGGGGRVGGFGPGGPRNGVFQVGLYHTVAFKDEVEIRPGVPTLDLLDGGALGSGGGSPRHQVDLQANYTRGGLGVAANAKWQSATKVTGLTAAEDLEFSDLTTVNLRLFADLGMQPIAREHRWLRGMRATLSVDNLFDERQDVKTPQGITPISYQPDLLDPVGRTVKFTVRKLFF